MQRQEMKLVHVLVNLRKGHRIGEEEPHETLRWRADSAHLPLVEALVPTLASVCDGVCVFGCLPVALVCFPL